MLERIKNQTFATACDDVGFLLFHDQSISQTVDTDGLKKKGDKLLFDTLDPGDEELFGVRHHSLWHKIINTFAKMTHLHISFSVGNINLVKIVPPGKL